MHWKRYEIVGLFALSVCCLGCGDSGPDIATVKGKVTMDDKPLANASIMFAPEGGRPAGAWTDEEGNYELNFGGGRQGAIPGKNIVKITTMADPEIQEDGSLSPARPETVPARYNQMTELEFDVKPGVENIANFDLSSEGPLRSDQTDALEAGGTDEDAKKVVD